MYLHKVDDKVYYFVSKHNFCIEICDEKADVIALNKQVNLAQHDPIGLTIIALTNQNKVT